MANNSEGLLNLCCAVVSLARKDLTENPADTNARKFLEDCAEILGVELNVKEKPCQSI